MDLEHAAAIANSSIDNFKGNSHELEQAIGMLFVGRRYGWKILYLIHSRKSVAKYESILGIKVQEVLPELGDRADRSLGWRMAKKVSSYWKAVKGEISGVKSKDLD